jgi:hypothetical protein
VDHDRLRPILVNPAAATQTSEQKPEPDTYGYGLGQSAALRSVVHGLAADLVVGVEEGLGEQVAYVSTAEAVDDSSPVPSAFDETGEAELGEMLTGYGRTAPCHLSQRRHIGIGLPQRPQQTHPGGISEQRKRHHGSSHPLIVKLVTMRGCWDGAWLNGGHV